MAKAAEVDSMFAASKGGDVRMIVWTISVDRYTVNCWAESFVCSSTART